MSSLFVKIVNFVLSPHPNADSLSLANPVGTSWQCVVRTENFENGGLAVYIPIDSILPSKLAEILALPNFKPEKPYRIRTIRLRGFIAQGLLLPLKDLIDLELLPPTNPNDKLVMLDLDEHNEVVLTPGTYVQKNIVEWQVGDDVASFLGITKYIEREPESQDTRREPEGFVKYTDIENIKNFPEILYFDEDIVATEKTHGSNFRAGWIEVTDLGHEPVLDFVVGTRRTALKSPNNVDGSLIADNRWTRVAARYNLKEKLAAYPGYIVFGECYGPGVQKLTYSQENVNLVLFDIWNGKRYMNYDEFLSFANDVLATPTVPVLYRGGFCDDVLNLRSGKTIIGDSAHIREGIVLRPTNERWDYEVGRVIFKSVSEDYLLGKFEAE